MQGTKHLIECSCFLPQNKNKTKIVYHKFVVFSIIDDEDAVIEKLAQCNNCGVIHRVYDICQSEILVGREDSKSSILTQNEISLMLPSAVSNVLSTYNADLATWEQALFNFENKIENLIIVSKEMDPVTFLMKGKIMKIIKGGSVKIETFVDSTFLENKEG
jgi:hypothetical protein